VDIASLIRHRLAELGMEQRELAAAANVTESYISQLLAKKKTPPSSSRTAIYGKIAKVLKVSSSELAKLADAQRREERRRKVLDPPRALHQEFRQLVLQKCALAKRQQIASIFEREPFGEFERFITQKLLDTAKRIVKREMQDEKWVYRIARVAKHSHEQTHASIADFLATDVFHVSLENCLSIFEPLIQSWEIDTVSFGMRILLNKKLTRSHLLRMEFKEEEEPVPPIEREPGLMDFLNDPKLSAGITAQETAFLCRLNFDRQQPSPLYFYRELQNLRDPLNFFPVTIVEREGRKGGVR
jgi:transcriptional regulator with XRE-family HTH domain